MKQTFFIAIILVLIRLQCLSQSAYQKDSLLLFEQQIFSSNSRNEKDSILFQKLNYALRINKNKTAYQSYLRLEKNYFKPHNKKYFWNSTLLCLDNFNLSSAAANFNTYRLDFDSTSLQSNILGYLVYVNLDSLAAKNYYSKILLQDSSLTCLDCFYKLLTSKTKKGRGYMLASGIVPGSGLIAVGKPIKGLTSMGLLGGLGYGVYQLLHHNMYLNAISWGFTFGSKFYLGQIKLTSKEFNKKQQKQKNKIQKKCKANYQSIMFKHQISYR